MTSIDKPVDLNKVHTIEITTKEVKDLHKFISRQTVRSMKAEEIESIHSMFQRLRDLNDDIDCS